MEKPVAGWIEFQGITYSRGLQRFVQKRMERWIADDHPEFQGPFRYEVSFFRQGEGHTVGCNLRVTAGNQLLLSSRYGSSPDQALLQCLEHLPSSPAKVQPRPAYRGLRHLRLVRV